MSAASRRALAVAASACTAAAATWLLARRRRRRKEQDAAPSFPVLAELVPELHSLLASRKPRHVEGVSAELHELPPFIPKAFWTKLGDALQPCERGELQRVPGERFMTLRLDGSGFSKLTRRLSSLGVFADGYSEEFADIMRECCQSLMLKTSARCGYTQSDEMTVVIAAANVVRGEQQCHTNGRRVLKLCTHAASHVTALFNFRLQALFAAKGVKMNDSLLACFDCRLGHYATLEEAMGLVLWRAADCAGNGISDAVYKSKGKIDGAGRMVGKATDEKLTWLAQKRLLPLKPHQAYGSFFAKVRRRKEGVNPKTGLSAPSLRGMIEEVPGNVLCLAARGALLPEDDQPLDSAEDA